jgi:thiamine-phosphate diphosphorylase
VDAASQLRKRLKGLYFILNLGRDDFGEIPLWFEGVIANGARIIQVRGKKMHPAKLTSMVRQVMRIAARYNALVIVNDFPGVARDAAAQGVHLGDEDMDIADAKWVVGGRGIIGATVRDLKHAAKAFKAGADYIAVGSIFRSPTKPAAKVVGIPVLEEIKHGFPNSPVCAIGGINADNIDQVLKTGVDMVAVVSAIASAQNPEKAAMSLAAAFSKQPYLLKHEEQPEPIEYDDDDSL